VVAHSPRWSDDHGGLVELGVGDADGGGEIVVREGWIQ
jgi:hypothetical protein